jgi:hypothetical protein
MGTAAKFKMEKLRLAQSEVVHGDNIKKDTLMKGLDLKHALHNQQHDAQRADLDFDRQREKDMMDAAKEQNQSAAQRLHEVGMANHQADIAREAQFMKPEGTE